MQVSGDYGKPRKSHRSPARERDKERETHTQEIDMCVVTDIRLRFRLPFMAVAGYRGVPP